MLARGWRPGLEASLLLMLGRGGETLNGGRGGSALDWRGVFGFAMLMARASSDFCGCWGPEARPRAQQLLHNSLFLLPAAPRRPPLLDLKTMPHTHALMDGSCAS